MNVQGVVLSISTLPIQYGDKWKSIGIDKARALLEPTLLTDCHDIIQNYWNELVCLFGGQYHENSFESIGLSFACIWLKSFGIFPGNLVSLKKN